MSQSQLSAGEFRVPEGKFINFLLKELSRQDVESIAKRGLGRNADKVTSLQARAMATAWLNDPCCGASSSAAGSSRAAAPCNLLVLKKRRTPESEHPAPNDAIAYYAKYLWDGLCGIILELPACVASRRVWRLLLCAIV